MSAPTQVQDFERLRHSSAHILAQAVQSFFPNVKLAIGPAIKDGFYYDFDLDRPFTEEDVKKIEGKCLEIIKEGQTFSGKKVARKEAQELFKKRGFGGASEPYRHLCRHVLHQQKECTA